MDDGSGPSRFAARHGLPPDQVRGGLPMAPPRAPSVPPYCASVLNHLLEAYDAARQLRRGTWQFACQLRTLILQGITDTALRWLVNKGYAEHRTERTTPQQPVRRF